MIHKMQRL